MFEVDEGVSDKNAGEAFTALVIALTDAKGMVYDEKQRLYEMLLAYGDEQDDGFFEKLADFLVDM